MRFHKTLTPIGNGNYLAELFDDERLIHDKEYSTYHVAECALDALIREMLTDLLEQGLIDDLNAALEAEGVTSVHVPGWQATIDVDFSPVGWPV